MNPHQKAKKLRRRVLAILASGHAYGEGIQYIARELGVDKGKVSSALDTLPRFLVGKHRSHRGRIAPGATKRHAGGYLSYALHRSRVSAEALKGLQSHR